MDETQRYLDEEIPGLLDLLMTSDVRELEIRSGDRRVRVHRRGDFTVQSGEDEIAAKPDDHVTFPIVAPIVGTFYQAPHEGMGPLVGEGSRVDESTVVGIIEALQVLTEVEAGRSGIIRAIYATDGQPVEYGQVLFEVEALG
ncbi:MAG TPA: biotin/lipoyl-containing protein [Chloroflexota bacterium]|nr:biotin/lipoyl-containing protein [Chloroflexota bacterium]